MRCDACANDNAIIQVQEIVDGKQSTIKLCAACASLQKFRLSSVAGGAMQKLMESVAEIASQLGGETSEEAVSCPECGCEAATIRKTGPVGCSNCYQVFSDLIGELFPDLAAVASPPEPPKSTALQSRPLSLDEQLALAVAEERYEDAARIRDQIRATSSGVSE